MFYRIWFTERKVSLKKMTTHSELARRYLQNGTHFNDFLIGRFNFSQKEEAQLFYVCKFHSSWIAWQRTERFSAFERRCLCTTRRILPSGRFGRKTRIYQSPHSGHCAPAGESYTGRSARPVFWRSSQLCHPIWMSSRWNAFLSCRRLCSENQDYHRPFL